MSRPPIKHRYPLEPLADAMEPVLFHALRSVGWQPSDADAEDELQDARLGLLLARRTFDAARTGDFKSYAWPCIRNEVVRGRRERLGCNFRRDPSTWLPLPLDEAPASSLTDSPEPSFRRVDAEAAIRLLSDRERVMCSQTAADAAAELGIKAASVQRQRVRVYARLRRQLGVAS